MCFHSWPARGRRREWAAPQNRLPGASAALRTRPILYEGRVVSILDTPGHQDFSEDTYRTLAAADNAVMLIDAAKGLEPQTRKLFEVAHLRRLPLFTFCNKLDRPSLSPFAICDEIEREFGVACCPMLWPVGSGDRFKGVLDRNTKLVHLFEKGARGKAAPPLTPH